MRVLLNKSYLFDFMNRSGKLPDSERRTLDATDRNELADLAAGTRLASMYARRNRDESIA